MIRKLLLILILGQISFYSFCQATKSKANDTYPLITLQEKQKYVDEQINQLHKDIEKLEKSTTENINSYKEDTKSLLNTYLSIVLGAFAVIGFAINFFGKNAIKKGVEEIIRDTAQKHTESKIVDTLNSKITNELIEEIVKKKSEEGISKILNDIELQGNNVIDEFKSKGDEAIKSMLAMPPIASTQINTTNLSELEIVQQGNTLQANEFFNIAFDSTDVRLQVSMYQNVLELEPRNVSALNNLAVAYNNLNDPNSAIEILNKAIEIDNKYHLAYTNRANSYYLKAEYQKGLEDIDKAISLNLKFYYSYVIKSLIYRKLGKFPEAENSLKTAVELDPESGEANFSLAFYYEETDQYDKSLKYYQEASRLNFPNKAMLFNNMAVLFRRQRKFDESLEYIEKARQINPSFPNLDGTTALIYADKNDDENFYKYLKIALEKGCKAWDYLEDPGFTKYRNTKRLQMLIKPFKQKYFA